MSAPFVIQTAPFLRGQTPPCSERSALFDAAGFSTSGGRTSEDTVRVARAVCRSCPLQVPCAQWAYDNDEFGFWGGTTDWERADARRKAAKAKPAARAVAS